MNYSFTDKDKVMATVNAVSNLNAAAHVFSPTPKLKLHMDDLKNVNRFDGLEINDYEERILIKKMVQRANMRVIE